MAQQGRRGGSVDELVWTSRLIDPLSDRGLCELDSTAGPDCGVEISVA